MKRKHISYLIINPLIIFLVYALSPILFDKEVYTSMRDAFGILTFYYVLMGGYYFIDFLSKKINKNDKEKIDGGQQND
ncbi:hypothetical protein OCD85_06980 [Bacillus pacificus]|uniref:Group-specific protein n=2 Tax=Bacillaceae TaxID=186817 RepID=A0A3P1BWP3_9BACI|nr:MULTISPECIES: hypothetical protein [Bacillus cereus group]AFQ08495.1 hypothetical protein BCK_02925 [Bacillus cereus FRI-35]KYQ02929.1 hypothetical protein B4079_1896 [Bacillus cereus]MBL3793349.1 hypothetical protein [Bacillus cereus]MBL3858922.1 hypothetical protein [Bacillus cereus]MCC2353029.1 hypothetical protein [Bacillus pacificus]